jgi:hypothetical protein
MDEQNRHEEEAAEAEIRTLFKDANLGDDESDLKGGKSDDADDDEVPPSDPRAEKRRRRERLRALLNERLADDDSERYAALLAQQFAEKEGLMKQLLQKYGD